MPPHESVSSFVAFGDELIISDAAGHELWRGKPDGHAVSFATSIPGSDDGLVLYQPYPAEWQHLQSQPFQNLVRIRADGSVRWRAELPDSFVRYLSAQLSPVGIDATAPSYKVVLDLETGRILDKVWTK